MLNPRLHQSFPLTVVLAGAALVVLAAATRMDAQAPTATAAERTTKAGVYTAEQAALGEQTYMSACSSCHPPGTHKGGAFLDWQGYTLDKLVEFLTESMPENEPGSLTPREYTQVVAYLLKVNGMPTGTEELPTSASKLSGIKIDLLPSRPVPSHILH